MNDYENERRMLLSNEFRKGAKCVIEEIRSFIEKENEFVCSLHSDSMLDRLAKELNKVEENYVKPEK